MDSLKRLKRLIFAPNKPICFLEAFISSAFTLVSGLRSASCNRYESATKSSPSTLSAFPAREITSKTSDLNGLLYLLQPLQILAASARLNSSPLAIFSSAACISSSFAASICSSVSSSFAASSKSFSVTLGSSPFSAINNCC